MSLISPNGTPDSEPDPDSEPELEPGAPDLFERFMALVPEVKSELGRLAKTRERIIKAHQEEIARLKDNHRAELVTHDERTNRLRAILRTLGGDDGPRRAKGTTSTKVADATLATFIRYILDQGDDLFTAVEIQERVGVARATTYAAFDMLRTMEFVRLVGVKEGTKRQTFRILDRHVGEELLARIEQQPQPKRERSSTANTEVNKNLIARVNTAIGRLDKPEFTAFDINTVMQLKSMKSIYEALRQMKRLGYIEVSGKEASPDDPRRQRDQFSITNRDALEELINA